MNNNEFNKRNDFENDNQNKEENKNPKDYADKTAEVVEKIVNTVDASKTFDPKDVQINKNIAVICYIGFLFLVPYLTGKHKNSKYLLFHINQGLNLFILEIILFLFSGLLDSLFTKTYLYSSYTPTWVSLIIYLLYSLLFVLSLFGIINTLNGKSRELPLIGRYRFLK